MKKQWFFLQRIFLGTGYSACELFFGTIYFFCKLTILLEPLIPMAFQLMGRLSGQPLSDGIVRRRWSASCSMNIDFRVLYRRLQCYNYFTERLQLTRELMAVLFQTKEWTALYGQVFDIQTNTLLIKGLKKELAGRISYPKETYVCDCIQPFEKLFFVSPIFLWQHLLCPDLYRVLFRKEKIYRISVRICDPMQ